MFKTILILSLLALTACAPAKSDSPQPSAGERVFQKGGGSITAPTSIVGTWEFPKVVQAGVQLSIRAQIDKDSTTIAGKCEFVSDGKVVATEYASATSPSSFTADTLTMESSVTETTGSGGRGCRATIAAGQMKYTINAAAKTLCLIVDGKCGELTKIAD